VTTEWTTDTSVDVLTPTPDTDTAQTLVWTRHFLGGRNLSR